MAYFHVQERRKLVISCAVSAGTRPSSTGCGEGEIVRRRENFLSLRPARPILHIQKRALQIGAVVSLPGCRVGFQEVPGMMGMGYGKGSLALRNRAEGVFEGYIVCRGHSVDLCAKYLHYRPRYPIPGARSRVDGAYSHYSGTRLPRFW